MADTGTSSSLTRVTVTERDTVGAIVPGMPPVAATPYLVAVAEIACYELVLPMMEEGEITVGTRVVIDHLGASRVGAELTVEAVLASQERNRYAFTVTIHDGERKVAELEHQRAAVPLAKILAAIG